jgi:hypothetical protein
MMAIKASWGGNISGEIAPVQLAGMNGINLPTLSIFLNLLNWCNLPLHRWFPLAITPIELFGTMGTILEYIPWKACAPCASAKNA